MKIDEQTNRLASEAQIRKQLRDMNRRKLLNSLDLYNYRIFYDQVQTVAAIKLHVPIHHWQRLLRFDLKTHLTKFERQTDLVR
jgi:hypothetical protein